MSSDECVNVLKVAGNRAVLLRFLDSIQDGNTFRICPAQIRLDSNVNPDADLGIECGEPAIKQSNEEETQAGFWFATTEEAPDAVYKDMAKTWPELRIRAWAEAPGCDYYYHGENIGREWISESLSFRETILSLCNRKRFWLKCLSESAIKRIDMAALLTDPDIHYYNYALPGDPVELDIVQSQGRRYEDFIRKHLKQ